MKYIAQIAGWAVPTSPDRTETVAELGRHVYGVDEIFYCIGAI
jgi:hypothetical protein